MGFIKSPQAGVTAYLKALSSSKWPSWVSFILTWPFLVSHNIMLGALEMDICVIAHTFELR
jgi:hypothetical protein